MPLEYIRNAAAKRFLRAKDTPKKGGSIDKPHRRVKRNVKIASVDINKKKDAFAPVLHIACADSVEKWYITAHHDSQAHENLPSPIPC